MASDVEASEPERGPVDLSRGLVGTYEESACPSAKARSGSLARDVEPA